MPSNDTIVFPAPTEVAVRSRERPEPGPGEVLVETERTLVSTGTELTVLSGSYPEGSVWDEYGTYPFTPGYNNVGRVVEVGDDVAAPAVGERVASWSPHAAYVTVDAEDCRSVPDAVAPDEAALFATAEIVMNGLRRGRVTWGEVVAVYGLGLLGQFAVRLARVAGAELVAALDVSEARLEYLPDGPAVLPLVPDADGSHVERLVEAANGRRADAVFEVTGNPDAIPDELEPLREQGRLVLLSSPRGETAFDFHDLCNAPSYEIVGAHQTSHPSIATPQAPWTKERHAELYFELLAQGRLDVSGLLTHAEPYDAAPALYESLLEDRTAFMGVLFEW